MRLKEVATVTAERSHSEARIVTDPKILVGKPVVRGTRIPVELVLSRLAENPDLDELFADYPRLTVDDVKACLAYAKALVEKQAPLHEARPPATPAILTGAV
jgi:uncharacterized protein (DUF433 family)